MGLYGILLRTGNGCANAMYRSDSLKKPLSIGNLYVTIIHVQDD